MEQVICERGIRYELRGEQYYPCFALPEPDNEQETYDLIVRQMAGGTGHQRGVEGARPNGVGGRNEQHPKRRKRVFPITESQTEGGEQSKMLFSALFSKGDRMNYFYGQEADLFSFYR